MILLCGFFSRTKLGIFSLKKCIYFHEDFVTVQTLSTFQHFLQNRRLTLLGEGGDGKDSCQMKALTPSPSLLCAPSWAA